MTGITDQDERVTRALLRNDLMHLTAAVECLRGDLQKMAVQWGLWRLQLVADMDVFRDEMNTFRNQMQVVRWAGGVVTAVVIALVVAYAKEVFGL